MRSVRRAERSSGSRDHRLLADRHPAIDPRPPAERALHLERAAERLDPDEHDLQPHPLRCRRRIEPDPVVLDGELEGPIPSSDPDRGVRLSRVASYVLQRLDAAEVDRRFGVRTEPLAVGPGGYLDPRPDAGLPDVRLERRQDPFLSEERREDTARQVPQALERRVRLGAQVVEEADRPVGVLLDARGRGLELGPDVEELTLRTLADVPLELAALSVPGRHQPLPRDLQLFRTLGDLVEPLFELDGQSDVPEGDPRLRREVLEEPFLGRGDRLPRWFGHRD